MKDALNQVGEGQNVDQGREVRESFKDTLRCKVKMNQVGEEIFSDQVLSPKSSHKITL